MQKKRKQLSKGRRKGLTLVEVCLALAVMMMIIPAVYSIIYTIAGSTPEIHSLRSRSAQLHGYVELCRSTLLNLPPTSRIQGTIEKIDGRDTAALRITTPPENLLIGERSELAEELQFTTRARLGGGVDLGINIVLPSDEVQSDEEEEKWLPLLPEIIDNVQWRYFDARSQQWRDEWRTFNSRPTLVELTFVTFEDSKSKIPTSNVFWLPPITPQREQSINDTPENESSENEDDDDDDEVREEDS
ncbi:MAG: hypothetical protein AAGA18_02400 [Verrucomicrobiota bacterium]